ncbi:MAG: dinitrogenase iron-molybdenum cofactor biosynthesis protein [Desulfobacteraceae bacterium 4572_35.1]|nr:MAG: dinitrogenase iron-molybdenum cofactor biosynthesis protein [Desulfobacteraceae bacterium 4572_35.1]
MKIAISTSGTTLDAPIDPRFGRAVRFLVYDLEQNNFTLVDNEQNLNATQGAGIQAAKTVVDCGAQAIISGHCGPKAFQVLSAAGIAIYHSDGSTVAEALEQYNNGQLQAATDANVEGHWV